MRTRLPTVLAAALALLAAVPPAVRAQAPTATPTPTATVTATPTADTSQANGSGAAEAPKNAPKPVQRVYDDYRRDGVIDVCAHTESDLQETLVTIEPAFDRDYPDFRQALEAGIARHKSGRCTDESSAGASPTATPTVTPAPTSGSGAGAAAGGGAAAGAGGAAGGGTESGRLPGGDQHAGSGTTPLTPRSGERAGAAATPAPAAVTPVPAATVPPATPAATVAPVVVTRTGHRSLTFPLILLAIALLGGAAFALFAAGGRRSPGARHAWREAAYRTRGTWADFSDWLRLGR
jgi:hypothetical protein